MKKEQYIVKIIVAIALLLGGYFYFKDFTINHDLPAQNQLIKNQVKTPLPQGSSISIDQLTQEDVVVNYIKEHKQLPHYYLTKNEAKKLGWKPHLGNLCEVLPGKAIGGDVFGNREKKLPLGYQYYEADINYHCGNRNAQRVVFTNNGKVWITTDHYKTFTKK